MKKLAHFCGIMLAATSFMFQSCDDSDGYSIGEILLLIGLQWKLKTATLIH